MLRTLELVEIEFGGVNRYTEEHCGLTSEDVKLIRHNLIQLRR
jgi:CRISPR/Cas system type I-B associated protein Csh2 (Cas7 group RAMP superfamily)